MRALRWLDPASIFIGTPSIFESLTLKQIDLYCKWHMDYTYTKLYYDIIFWAIGINAAYNDVTMVLTLNRISALFSIFFWNAFGNIFFG